MTIIACSHCQARYRVDDEKLARARKLKCVRCKIVFHVPQEPESEPVFKEQPPAVKQQSAEQPASTPQDFSRTVLRDRYRLEGVIGKGGSRITYKAFDMKTKRRIAVKRLQMELIKEWKTFDLFEREANILQHLDHPRIPDYYDYFSIENPTDIQFFLIQDYLEGKTLQQIVEEGWHGEEEEILDLFLQLVDILDYLHHLEPLVLHRNINSKNIIISSDKQVYLVNFGAIREAIRTTVMTGTTVVDTFGYLPFEQFSGYASEASDFYAAGAALLYMLTHRDPADFPVENLKLQFENVVKASPRVIKLLKGILKHDVEQRIHSAAKVREILFETPAVGEIEFKNPGTILKKRETKRMLRIEILQKRHSATATRFIIGVISAVLSGFAVFFIFATASYWASMFRMIFAYQEYDSVRPPLLFILPFTIASSVVGLLLFVKSVFDREKKVFIELTRKKIQVKQPHKTDVLPVDNLRSISVSIKSNPKGYPLSQITFYPSTEAEPLQCSLKLMPAERDQLVQNLNTFYARLSGKFLPVDRL